MLYRKFGGGKHIHVAAGALCLAIGIMLERLCRRVYWDQAANASFWTGDFMHGLLTGLAVVLIGLSIPLNLIAARRSRLQESK